MPVASVGPVSLPDVQMESWLIKFDKMGQCTSPLTRQALLDRLVQADAPPVIFFSHGWNNDFDDATELYRQFLLRLQDHIQANNPAMVRPLFVGVLWPSIWLDFDKGMNIAGGLPAPAGSPMTAGEQRLAGELADQLPPGAQRERFEALMAGESLDADGVAQLAALLQRALDGAAGPAGAAPSAEDLASALNALPAPRGYGVDDGDGLGEGGTIDAAAGNGAPLRPAGLLNYFDPRNALRVASVYQMKDRAGVVGSNGVAALLSAILERTTGRVHLAGHSYGCKVVLSALAAANSPRPATSVLLLQPAISHLAFATETLAGSAGGYADVIARIERSLLMTYSANDIALHGLFHLALRRSADVAELRISAAAGAGEPPSRYAALGGYGPRMAGQRLIDRLPDPSVPYDLPRTPVPTAFDGSGGQIKGHGDVATAWTAWLMYLQLRN